MDPNMMPPQGPPPQGPPPQGPPPQGPPPMDPGMMPPQGPPPMDPGMAQPGPGIPPELEAMITEMAAGMSDLASAMERLQVERDEQRSIIEQQGQQLMELQQALSGPAPMEGI